MPAIVELGTKQLPTPTPMAANISGSDFTALLVSPFISTITFTSLFGFFYSYILKVSLLICRICPAQNSELFTLTYGALVVQLLNDLESVEDVNKHLDRMGYNIGVRLVEDFIARTSADKCYDLRETADKLQVCLCVCVCDCVSVLARVCMCLLVRTKTRIHTGSLEPLDLSGGAFHDD